VTSIFIAPQYEKADVHNHRFLAKKRLSRRKAPPLTTNPVAMHQLCCATWRRTHEALPLPCIGRV
jgi:hypothetical protein